MSRLTKWGRTQPAIRQKALELTRNIPPKNWAAQVNALFEFVRDSVRYTRDVRCVETLAEPTQTLRQMQGDCDDKAVLLASLLESIGHPTRFVAVGSTPGRFSHVIPQTLLGRRWVWLETTEGPVRRMGHYPSGIQSRMYEHV